MPQQVSGVQQAPADLQQVATSKSVEQQTNGLTENKPASKPTKPNGLKNRIIQRPPPLILDKVSNFYDNDGVQLAGQSSEFDTPFEQLQAKPALVQASHHNHQQQQQQQQHQQQATNGAIPSSANHKFWASLNENASRARGAASNPSSSSQQLATNANNATNTNGNISNDNNNRESIDSGGVGVDLIITRRTSNSNSASNGTYGNISHSQLTRANSYPASESIQFDKQTSENQQLQQNEVDSVTHLADDDEGSRKLHNMSNSSEQDAPSEHGGNLIGVEITSTPPPVSNLPEPPHSAASSRPRSNNPFLATDEELELSSPTGQCTFHKRPASFIAATSENRTYGSTARKNQLGTNENNFGNAYDIVQTKMNNIQLGAAFDTQKPADGKFMEREIKNETDPRCANERESIYVSAQINDHNQISDIDATNAFYKPDSMVMTCPSQLQPQHHSNQLQQQHQPHQQQSKHPKEPQIQKQQFHSQAQQQQQHHLQISRSDEIQMLADQSIYNIFPRTSSQFNHEPSISLDSESAICQPPPSATMQLPRWTDAIYELNNAILETSSVAGGSDNGQFIYIIGSGDIILELDQTKVSGYTLAEFNQLLESKPVHLLKAVQTKHSHGLTTNLKHYLSIIFPKDSTDRDLQNLIRENIYRGTIPCTTRPPKDGELNKVDYHFLTKEQFLELNNKGLLLECGMYGGHYYGTLRPNVNLDSLSDHASQNNDDMSLQQATTATDSAPTIGLPINHAASNRKVDTSSSLVQTTSQLANPLYENYESLKMHDHNHVIRQQQLVNMPQSHYTMNNFTSLANRPLPHIEDNRLKNVAFKQQPSIVAVDSEALPHGWERVIDQTHGTYYIDHNTQRTQYEQPYEIELTKGQMGLGFTLVEAENNLLLVRSVIQGGPAHSSGIIRPGDILLSAVGVSVTGLAHTDVARLFSTFAVGDRVRLTFARSSYVVDANLIPDEFLFSNGTNGDMALAVNTNYLNYYDQNVMPQNPHHILVNQEYEYITVILKRGDQGFGFTISDSLAGQKVRNIQNTEVCSNLKQNDILINLDGQDVTKLTHQQVVEMLKKCQPGKDVVTVVKRKKRFRSKTPVARRTETDEYPLNLTPQRNCKTPSVDGLMLRRANTMTEIIPHRSLFNGLVKDTHNQNIVSHNEYQQINSLPIVSNVNGPPTNTANDSNNDIYGRVPSISAHQSIYGVNPLRTNEQLYFDSTNKNTNIGTIQSNQSRQIIHPIPIPPPLPPPLFQATANRRDVTIPTFDNNRPPSLTHSDGFNRDNTTNSVNMSETSLPPIKFTNVDGLSQLNQYNSFMNNDRLVMMQMQQPQYQQLLPQPMTMPQASSINPDYHQIPIYSNRSEILRAETNNPLPVPAKPIRQYMPQYIATNANSQQQSNYYANNEEIALQRVQYGSFANNDSLTMSMNNSSISNTSSANYHHHHHYGAAIPQEENDEYEYHEIDLDRGNTDSNWGIRLIGGAEADRAISIGSIVFGGVASKNGKLRSGDEIISVNGTNVVGAAHQYVVKLISACSNRAAFVIRRKKFAEACDVVLARNLDEGFGFVIISSGSCALIGRIIEGSPADRCRQLHVRDRIIAVNGKYITPNMQHPEIVNMIKECGSTLRLRIIPVDCYTVELIKNAQNDNFGFSMRGGSEYDGTPLYILRVAPDGLARDLLNVGDQIIEINNIPTVGMTHLQAATIIKYSDPIVKLKLRRNYVTPPSLLVDSPRALQKFNQVTAEIKTVNQNTTPNLSNPDTIETSSSDHGYYDQQQHHQQSLPQPQLQSQPQQSHSLSMMNHHPNHQMDAAAAPPPSTNNLVYNQNQSMALYAT